MNIFFCIPSNGKTCPLQNNIILNFCKLRKHEKGISFFFFEKGISLSVSVSIFCAMQCLVAQLCLTLWDPMNHIHQAPLSMGILQARILEWVAMPSSRRSSPPRGWTCITRGFFTIWATGETQEYWSG